jgi:hypothetical protein
MPGNPRPAPVLQALATTLALMVACDQEPDVRTSRNRPVQSAPATDPIFTDITAEVGLNFVHHIGATGRHYVPEIVGGGGALFDFDRDGDLDVYAIQGAMLEPGASTDASTFPLRGIDADDPPTRNRLYRNELIDSDGRTGRLTFVDVTDAAGVGDTGYGMGCAVGDYDNDGAPDLYVTNFGPNVLLHNNGDGTFTDRTEHAGVGDPRWGCGAAFLDYDRDGNLDLFVTHYIDYSLAQHRPCEREGGRDDYCGPLAFEPIADVLFHNNGDGTFTDASVSSGIHRAFGYGLGVVCADFNRDGWIDIYVANDATPNQLWINRHDGTFVDDAMLAGAAVNADGRNEAGMGVTAGDFDGDGDEDIFLTHEMEETNTLYRSRGDGLFDDATFDVRLARPSMGMAGWGTAWFDYDNDGSLDLFVSNGALRRLETQLDDPWPYKMPDQLFRNAGERFVETTDQAGAALTTPHTGRGTAFGDVDNDGDIDLLCFSNNEPLRLLRNNHGNRQPWAMLEVVDRKAGRHAYGARVEIKLSDDRTLWRRVHTDGSYCSAGDPRIHVGLGRADRIGSVTVHWITGEIERWTYVPTGKITTLREGR